MKHNNALLHGCLLARRSDAPSVRRPRHRPEQPFSRGKLVHPVRQGRLQDIKKEVKETVDELTGDDKTDTQKFQERRDKDLKKYQKEVRDAQKDYAKKREKAQALNT